ncbi:MAG TPA: hypothetical protein VFE47_31800 [Tepidisphaeraceae bacterium]|jgi:hypothetical protein|nr:hypothetical protein [Tepidisphaeraceae bacterium]
MIKAFFYLGATSEVPLGETEFWITDVPRQGETVTLSYYSPGTASSPRRDVTGRVLHVGFF